MLHAGTRPAIEWSSLGRRRASPNLDLGKRITGGWGEPDGGGITSDNDLVDELHCPEKTAEEQLINKSDSESARKSIVDAMQELSSFEREIIIARNLQTPSATIDVLSERFGVSGERLRQIERRAMSRLKYELLCRGVTSFRVM